MIAARALDFTVYLRGSGVYGSGVLVDSRGHVLTADHVVDGIAHMVAFFHEDPEPIGVKVIDRDAQVDLALLQLERIPEGRRPARLGRIEAVQIGDDVFAMGSPRKMPFSLSRGTVSYSGRMHDATVYLQTDLAANEGSSGGPVMNGRGDVVGVASYILRQSQGLAFAVPVDYAYARFDAMAGQGDDAAFERWLAARGAPTYELPAEQEAAGAESVR